jgi:hypothetical protein
MQHVVKITQTDGTAKFKLNGFCFIEVVYAFYLGFLDFRINLENLQSKQVYFDRQG